MHGPDAQLRLASQAASAVRSPAQDTGRRPIPRRPRPRARGQESPIAFAQPEVTLPVQFFTALRGRSSLGELRLLCAVVEDAVQCFQRYAQPKTTRQRRLFRDAEQWIMFGEAEQLGHRHLPGLDFEYVCSVLDLDPGYLRDGLRRWRQQQLAAAAPAPHLAARASAHP
jgi:hypothetical protein